MYGLRVNPKLCFISLLVKQRFPGQLVSNHMNMPPDADANHDGTSNLYAGSTSSSTVPISFQVLKRSATPPVTSWMRITISKDMFIFRINSLKVDIILQAKTQKKQFIGSSHIAHTKDINARGACRLRLRLLYDNPVVDT